MTDTDHELDAGEVVEDRWATAIVTALLAVVLFWSRRRLRSRH
jgi:hypothetical protein